MVKCARRKVKMRYVFVKFIILVQWRMRKYEQRKYICIFPTCLSKLIVSYTFLLCSFFLCATRLKNRSVIRIKHLVEIASAAIMIFFTQPFSVHI